MAAADCVFHRTLTRSRPGPNKVCVCRDVLFVSDVQRYSRDQGSSVYFPQAVLNADLISTAAQLVNQRRVCVLEACHLGGATTKLILSRAFPLTD
ncbi:hypothetical protein PFLUV_G00171120 [Perca fluviatilis]|uniref:Uncharacterized protein n=1 Tax=Perca fluviatilis TaxID=8168 RepID=A0A6A5F1Z9_PERFL|nr:hypothetical protein PFLUV_G00171120 [Perca fluviatilis]